MAGIFFVVILIVALNEFATDMCKTLYQNNEKKDKECLNITLQSILNIKEGLNNKSYIIEINDTETKDNCLNETPKFKNKSKNSEDINSLYKTSNYNIKLEF